MYGVNVIEGVNMNGERSNRKDIGGKKGERREEETWEQNKTE